MTFNNTITRIIQTTNDTLSYPINVVIHFINANHIAEEHTDRDIDNILNDKIIDIESLSIAYSTEENTIINLSFDFQSSSQMSSYKISHSGLNIKNYLENFLYIATTKDKKFKIYLGNILEDEILTNINGVLYQKYFSLYEKKYKFDKIALPKFKDYTYNNLFIYKDEDSFINAILLEFILRQINHNDITPDILTVSIEQKEAESEVEMEARAQIQRENIEHNISNLLQKHFGLTYEEIISLEMSHNYHFTKSYQENDISLQLKSSPLSIQIKETDYSLSSEELIKQIKKEKENYDIKSKNCINLKTRLSKEYLDNANDIINKFPNNFKLKQKQVIEALFIFDYIQARKIHIDHLNNDTDNTQESSENHIPYPTMNPTHEGSFFHEIENIIDIKKGQAKKIHHHIHKFLELKIP